MTTTYQPFNEPTKWMVSQFDKLAAQFGITADQLPDFHRCLSRPNPLNWTLLRLTFGIHPELEAEAPWDADQISSRFGHDQDDLELIFGEMRNQFEEHLRTVTNSAAQTEESPPIPPAMPPSETESSAAPTECSSESENLSDDELKLLRKFGFRLSMFRMEGRAESGMIDEARWFVSRLADLRKAFEDPVAKSVAEQCLRNELIIRRMYEQLLEMDVASEEFAPLHQLKQKTEDVYRKQYEQLEELCPFVKAATVRQHFSGVISEIIDGVKQYKARGDTQIIDGLFTALEIQVQMRQSQQEEPRYRPGLIAAINEAKKGLWDPKFRRTIPDSVCRMLDAGFQEGVRRLNEAHGTKLIDLESDSPENEYPPLVVPPSSSDGDVEEQQTDHEKVQEPVELQDYPEAHLNRSES